MAKLYFTFLFVVASFFTQAQNVGIGNTNPTEKLEVTGNVKADTVKPAALKLTTNAGTGKVLTSDAGGNASWAASSTVAGNVGYGLWGDCATNGSISEYLPVADSMGGYPFGYAVSVSGEFAFIGAHSDADQGSVIVYKYENSKWTFFTKLTDATGAPGDRFGFSICVSGNFAIIGSDGDDVGANNNQGSASIFQFNGTNWVFTQKITDATGAADDQFGFSVSLSGNRAIVGATSDNGINPNEGSASIFQYNGSAWVLMIKLTRAAAAGGDQFGRSVSISGDKAIIGAPFVDNTVLSLNDAGRASIYHFNNTTWILQFDTPISNGVSDNQGYSVAIHNNYAVIGRPNRNNFEGDALVYFYNGSSWSLVSTISRPSVAQGDRFGWNVSISGNYILVGAPNDDVSPNTDEGGVSLFTRLGNFWQQQQYITDPSGSSSNVTGSAVAIDGTTKRFLIGVPGAFSSSGKAIFGKVN